MWQEVLDFWFKEVTPKQWFEKDDAFDKLIASRFMGLVAQAKAGELAPWRSEAKGALAEVILLDQFSRNVYRDQPESFAADPMALALAQCAIEKGQDLELSEIERSFLYMPFMHSESLVIHEQAVGLFESLGLANSLEFEKRHKAIIERFGRYPHRNEILGRVSTDEEMEFLKQPNSGF